MNNESDKYIIFSSIVGILLTISEILPYIKNIKSNGIIEFFIEICIFLLKKNKPKNVTSEQDNQREQLLENFLEESLHEINRVDTGNLSGNLSDKNSVALQNANLIFTAENITITFNSPNQVKIN
jgi:hypothetical protein